MTAIAIWHNAEVPNNPGLWVVADSLVSDSGTKMIDDAVKIFSLPIICRAPDKDGFFSQVYHAHTIGYCFAGSTLMGQNTYLALAPLLSNLVSPNSYVPSLADVACHALAYLKGAFDDYKVRVRDRAIFEVALFGFCHRSKQLCAFHLMPQLVDGTYEMTCESHPGMNGHDFIYLGADKPRMLAQIADAFQGDTIPGRPISRIPRYVVQDLIDDESCPTIGGDVQLGIADRYGYRPFSLCKPRVFGKPEAYLAYLGRELTPELSVVGQAQVGMTGIT